MPQAQASTAQLNAVARSLAAGRTQAALDQLNGFRSRVQNGTGTVHSTAQAAQLMAAVNTLIGALGG